MKKLFSLMAILLSISLCIGCIGSFKVVAECGRTGYYGLGTKEMNAIICNMALAYKFMKNKRGELRLSCDDVLNQNNCFTQQTNELFRRKSTANVIGRHAMLTFTYNFNTYKGHQ